MNKRPYKREDRPRGNAAARRARASVLPPGVMRAADDPQWTREYRAPTTYVGLFYGLLGAWTAVCVPLLGSKAMQSGWSNVTHLLIIAFILAYTWYFSLGISYKMGTDEDGNVRLDSTRRVLRLSARDIEMVEGPHLPVGFMRFRLEREKAYLFCTMRNGTLQEFVRSLARANPDIILKNV